MDPWGNDQKVFGFLLIMFFDFLVLFENYGSCVGNAGLLVLVALSCALLALPLFVTDDALSLQSTGGR
ncbi:hypothetical protein NC651_000314 [Populus alba x Populus x berolinensis]|nr:hypothetical protein NC651_000314 [Populus alba x Populus x berolinensis]